MECFLFSSKKAQFTKQHFNSLAYRILRYDAAHHSGWQKNCDIEVISRNILINRYDWTNQSMDSVYSSAFTRLRRDRSSISFERIPQNDRNSPVTVRRTVCDSAIGFSLSQTFLKINLTHWLAASFDTMLRITQDDRKIVILKRSAETLWSIETIEPTRAWIPFILPPSLGYGVTGRQSSSKEYLRMTEIYQS